jgi:hypothetical protein
MNMSTARRIFATPRSLPKPNTLGQRVVVLDIAFASSAGGSGFESVTLPFITALGDRLVAWIDHHDSLHHALYANDPRFVLRTKAQHPACPELVTTERVRAAGAVDTVVCHGDFDGLASAAKWLRGGVECYPGCDADARAIDTRTGTPSKTARRIDRAIRGTPRDHLLLDQIVSHLVDGATDPELWSIIDAAGSRCAQLEAESARLAEGYQLLGNDVALVDVTGHGVAFDKTELLLLGQQRARIAVVVSTDSITLASAFDSGVNFLELLGLSGGMPTVVSVQRQRLPDVLRALGVAD